MESSSSSANKRLKTVRPNEKGNEDHNDDYDNENTNDGSNASTHNTANILVQHHVAYILLNTFEYLDTVSLIQKKSVSKQWKELCTKAIDNKCNSNNNKKKIESNKELRAAVNKYSPGANVSNRPCTAIDAEEIASTYGYPINKWDVSNIKDFSFMFENNFNEPIGSWDVSNATNMYGMFGCARSFNQDLSSWDVSNVTDMNWMFWDARSFNQDISSWDVSNVTNMSYMFCDAMSFNQDISSWDVSNVTNSNAMFFRSGFDANQLPWFRV